MIPVLLVLAAVALGVIALVYGLPHLWRRWHERRLRGLCRRHGALVLTYDDGPGRELTPRVLECLGSHKAHGTFFALGRRAEQAPEILDRVMAQGHEIGCHAYEHVNAWKVFPTRALWDLRRGFSSLARWVGSNGIFRPPHGKLNLFSMVSLLVRRAPAAWWTDDSGDTWPSLPSIDDTVRGIIARRGGVVLMHDFDRGGDPAYNRARADYICTLTSALLEASAQENIRVLSLEELFALAAHE